MLLFRRIYLLGEGVVGFMPLFRCIYLFLCIFLSFFIFFFAFWGGLGDGLNASF